MTDKEREIVEAAAALMAARDSLMAAFWTQNDGGREFHRGVSMEQINRAVTRLGFRLVKIEQEAA